ncbi:hypothetical protein ACJX0J_024300, partial [Zea mays]
YASKYSDQLSNTKEIAHHLGPAMHYFHKLRDRSLDIIEWQVLCVSSQLLNKLLLLLFLLLLLVNYYRCAFLEIQEERCCLDGRDTIGDIKTRFKPEEGREEGQIWQEI